MAGIFQPGLRQDDQELLASIPTHDVVRTDDVLEKTGNVLEHFIAGQMTEPVIDGLEMIDIGDNAAQRRVQAFDLLELLVEPAQKIAAG